MADARFDLFGFDEALFDEPEIFSILPNSVTSAEFFGSLFASPRQNYTRESIATLPTTPDPLATLFTSTDITDVATDNGVRVGHFRSP